MKCNNAHFYFLFVVQTILCSSLSSAALMAAMHLLQIKSQLHLNIFAIHTCLIIVLLYMLVRSLLGINNFDSKIPLSMFLQGFRFKSIAFNESYESLDFVLYYCDGPVFMCRSLAFCNKKSLVILVQYMNWKVRSGNWEEGLAIFQNNCHTYLSKSSSHIFCLQHKFCSDICFFCNMFVCSSSSSSIYIHMRSKEFQAITTLLNFQLVVREGLPRKNVYLCAWIMGKPLFHP